MIAYTCGSYDILRAKDLQELDRQIQLSKQNGTEIFGVGVYNNDLCEALGLNLPLKSLQDRMNIVQELRGVDFVFEVGSLDKNLIKNTIKNLNPSKRKDPQKEYDYELSYAPGTYDLFHAGHLENLLEATKKSKKLIVGIKSDELVEEHKHKKPILSATERAEILRHFRFVYDTYIYHTRDLHVANEWMQAKYGKSIDAVFLGSDLKKDFENVKDLNVVFTERDEQLMKERSTTSYAKKYKTLKLGTPENKTFTGNINKNSKSIRKEDPNKTLNTDEQCDR